MICKECLWLHDTADFDPFNNLPSECDPLMHHGLDIRPDLVGLRPQLHPRLNLTRSALLDDSVGLVDPCERLLESTPVTQLLTLIQDGMHLL
jgi:hypothetical protein